MRVAIVGTGISGLVCAHLLHPHHDITVFEANGYAGGHTNTVEFDLDGRDYAIDTGFIVYNERNYPNFVRLLHQLGVATQPSAMSFSVSNERSGLEWRGTNLGTVFAQPKNVLRPSFHRMLVDVVRFNRAAKRLVAGSCTAGAEPGLTLREFTAGIGVSRSFLDDFLVPFGAAVWSADPRHFLEMPAATYARFMANHSLLDIGKVPDWRTVTGGSKQYVDALIAPFADRIQLCTPVSQVVRRPDGVEVMTAGGSQHFDRVVLANHSDQALSVLADASPVEREVLGALRYQPNTATLHTDETALPRSRRARASWNYHVGPDDGASTVTYWMNELQAIDSPHQFLVTLNRPDAIDHSRVIAEFRYSHPVFDTAAIGAQARRHEVQGRGGVFFAGAYWGYGFHEDGVRSALDVCRHFGAGLDGVCEGAGADGGHEAGPDRLGVAAAP